jgi:hypothetical protein
MINLLKSEIRESRHEIDLYGFSEILEEITNIKRPIKPLATWVHGWNFQPITSPRPLSAFGEYLNYRRIVRTINEKNILEEYGFKNIKVGGLPFQYVKFTSISRKSGSLVLMGEHSLSVNKKEAINRWNSLINEVDTNYKNIFSEIKICMTGEDYNNNLIIKLIESRGYEVIIGGYKNDKNSLKRLRQIFDYFEFAVTTCLGSHIVYAHYSGCKMGVIKKYFGLEQLSQGQYGPNYNCKKYKNDENIYNDQIISNKIVENYKFLFFENFNDLIKMKNYYDWAYEEIGGKNKFLINQLPEVLVWTSAEYLAAIPAYINDKIFCRRSI